MLGLGRSEPGWRFEIYDAQVVLNEFNECPRFVVDFTHNTLTPSGHSSRKIRFENEPGKQYVRECLSSSSTTKRISLRFESATHLTLSCDGASVGITL